MTENTPAQASDNADTAPAPAKGGDHMIPKARLDQEIGKRKDLAEQVASIAHVVLANIPENLKALIPEELSPAEQVAWYLRAKETGVFDASNDVKPSGQGGEVKEVKDVPNTDTGKPKVTPQDQDLSTLPPVARMARAYEK